MSEAFDKIRAMIPQDIDPCRKNEEIKIISRLLRQSFVWESTLEGVTFWNYVNDRLVQLSNGIGYKKYEDIQ